MKTKALTLNALFIAITLVLALIPGLGMIQLGTVSITLMHIPVILAGLTLGSKSAIFNSIIFGVVTLIIAATRPTQLFDPLFVNPLVSVLPRILFGCVVAVLVQLFKKIHLKNHTKTAIITAVSSLAHTIFVMVALYFAIRATGTAEMVRFTSVGIFAFVGVVLLANGLVEAIVSVLIVVPTDRALKKIQ